MLAQLQETLDYTSGMVSRAPHYRLDAPTPCADWDVRALLNHMIGGNLAFGAVAQGEPMDLSLFDRDNIGRDPATAYRESADAALEAWRRPGVMEEKLRFATGLPGSVVIGIYLLDELVHGWDLAQATGQDSSIPAHLCELALEFVKQLPADQIRVPGIFGPEVEAGPDAPIQDRLIAFVGRRPLSVTAQGE